MAGRFRTGADEPEDREAAGRFNIPAGRLSNFARSENRRQKPRESATHPYPRPAGYFTSARPNPLAGPEPPGQTFLD